MSTVTTVNNLHPGPVSIICQQWGRLLITSLMLTLSALGGACSRIHEKSTVVSNGLRLKEISAAIKLHLADKGNLPETIFGLPGYDDQVKFIDPESKHLFDWLFFPSGLRAGKGEAFYVMSPAEVFHNGVNCRIVLFKDGVVDVLPLDTARLVDDAKRAQGTDQ